MRRLAALVTIVSALACSSAPEDPEPMEVAWPRLDCDPIAPDDCMFPFPSNVFTVEDATTPTGRRVDFERASLPIDFYDVTIDPAQWNELDGFSSGVSMMTHLPGATLTGLAGPFEIERSLADDHPTVVIDADTGERLPHWVELDMRSDDDTRRAFMIRPAVRPKDGTRYIVAIRNVVDAGGEPLAASEAFAALRDRTAHDDPSIEARRGLYGDIFARLREAGVPRDDLQLAWDFTTSSRENNTSWMLHMRDTALAIVGTDGPEYTIESVEEDPSPEVALKIRGQMRVPLFLDQPGPGAHMIRGADGLPMVNPDMPWAEYPFTVWIPPSARESPASLAQFGHGLFSEQEEVEWFELPFASTYNYVEFAVDWIGFANDDDRVHVAGVVSSGHWENFTTVTARSHQGILNHLLAMRMMVGRFAREPMIQFDGRPAYDASRRYYYGCSQGGILGGVYMALSTDVTRGMLDTTGQPYNLLLPRSADFDEFFAIIAPSYENPIDRMFLLALVQMLWDRVEPNGYTPYIARDMLPGTPMHEVMIRPALGDHQVSTLGAHIMARTIGAVHFDTGVRDVFGLEKVSGTFAGGSALVEYDFGLPMEPAVNLPLYDCMDPHDVLRTVPAGQQQLDRWFQTGEIANDCPNGVCSFPELSGCP